MVAPPACVEDELESGRLVALGSEPHLVSGYGIVRLRSQPLTAAGERFREYVLEAERLLFARQKELLDRYRPRPPKRA
jgi:DNA-binding transcriptional LysR family regulator